MSFLIQKTRNEGVCKSQIVFGRALNFDVNILDSNELKYHLFTGQRLNANLTNFPEAWMTQQSIAGRSSLGKDARVTTFRVEILIDGTSFEQFDEEELPRGHVHSVDDGRRCAMNWGLANRVAGQSVPISSHHESRHCVNTTENFRHVGRSFYLKVELKWLSVLFKSANIFIV